MHFSMYYFTNIYILFVYINKYTKKIVSIIIMPDFYFIEKPSYFSSFSEVSLYWYTGNSHLLPQIGKVTKFEKKRKCARSISHN